MKYTVEMLADLHAKIREACIAKWDVDPDYFKIYDDGSICCFYTPSYSYADEESFDIELSDLGNENLDALISERKQREKEASDKLIEDRRLANEKRAAKELEERKAMYFKLKKEFGNL